MKAVRVLEYGGPLAFDDVPTPTIASGEVLEASWAREPCSSLARQQSRFR